MLLSLCIPTLDRYDNFLSSSLPKYLKNEMIGEIIICDENGNDADKIEQNFFSEKLKIFRNKEILGPFRNKLQCISKCENDWIAIIDSDNYADDKYFTRSSEYIIKKDLEFQDIIFPEIAKPNFNYTCFSNSVITKENASLVSKKADQLNLFLVMLNTGNFVLNKKIINLLDLNGEEYNIQQSDSCDVIYLLNLLFEQSSLRIHVVEGLNYEHTVHEGSVYLQKSKELQDFNNKTIERIKRNLSI